MYEHSRVQAFGYCPGDCSPAMPSLLSRAGMAYAHELSFMVCFAALTAKQMIRLIPIREQPQN